jgi:hypothetical protein
MSVGWANEAWVQDHAYCRAVDDRGGLEQHRAAAEAVDRLRALESAVAAAAAATASADTPGGWAAAAVAEAHTADAAQGLIARQRQIVTDLAASVQHRGPRIASWLAEQPACPDGFPEALWRHQLKVKALFR